MSSIQTNSSYTDSAVLIPTFEEQGELHLLLTKRSQKVLHHKGQICFPGGVKETIDSSLWHTALRETHEEIGLAPQFVYHIDQLNPVYTITGFMIQPFLAFMTKLPRLSPNDFEIDKILKIPLKHLIQIEYFEEHSAAGQTIKMPCYPFEGEKVWGATARIIYDLIHSKL